MFYSNIKIDTDGNVVNNFNNELEYKSIVPPRLNPCSTFCDNITDKTKFINIHSTDLDSMFLSIDKVTKSKIPEDEIKNFHSLSKSGKENIVKKLIHLETGCPEELVRVFDWHKIDGKWYYFKNKLINGNINELLGEVISEYFGLDTIHYKLARIHDGKDVEEGLISENFCNPNYVYRTCKEYGPNFSRCKNFDALTLLKDICPNDNSYKLLLSDIKKFIIRDFCVGQKDRYYQNFLFKEKGNSVRLAPLYDYERSFYVGYEWVYESSLVKMDIYDDKTVNFLRDDPEFQYLLNLLLDMDIEKLIEIVKNRHNILIEDFRVDLYRDYTNLVKELIGRRNLIK